jgi:hypothetical protein
MTNINQKTQRTEGRNNYGIRQAIAPEENLKYHISNSDSGVREVDTL